MILRGLRGWLGNWERDDQGRRRPGSWAQSFSGQRIFHLDPRADEIHFDDICVPLAREGRYANQTRDIVSVATHSVIVSVYAEKFCRERYPGFHEDAVICGKLGLMHDGSEALIGDVTRYLKNTFVMRGYRKLEKKWEHAINERFDIHPLPWHEKIVAECDKRVVLDEVEQLMIDPDMWPRSGRYPGMQPLGVEIPVLTWQQSADLFAARFLQLWPEP